MTESAPPQRTPEQWYAMALAKIKTFIGKIDPDLEVGIEHDYIVPGPVLHFVHLLHPKVQWGMQFPPTQSFIDDGLEELVRNEYERVSIKAGIKEIPLDVIEYRRDQMRSAINAAHEVISHHLTLTGNPQIVSAADLKTALQLAQLSLGETSEQDLDIILAVLMTRYGYESSGSDTYEKKDQGA